MKNGILGLVGVFAIADLHLAYGVPEKTMEVFGGKWVGYMEKLTRGWRETVGEEDLVLLPGDFSWAMTLQQAQADFAWLESMPGTKLLIRGNHDYWWSSLAKVRAALPPSCHALQNDALLWQGVAIGGTRLWDTPEFGFGFTEGGEEGEDKERIFVRELNRLELSLKQLDPRAAVRIALTHYPPIGRALQPSRASALLEKYGITHCLFGHLHNQSPEEGRFGLLNGIQYILTAADYLDFKPLRIL